MDGEFSQEKANLRELINLALAALRVREDNPRLQLTHLAKLLGVSSSQVYRYVNGGFSGILDVPIRYWDVFSELLDRPMKDLLIFCRTGEWPAPTSPVSVDSLEDFATLVVSLAGKFQQNPVHPYAKLIEQLKDIENRFDSPEIARQLLARCGIDEKTIDMIQRGEPGLDVTALSAVIERLQMAIPA